MTSLTDAVSHTQRTAEALALKQTEADERLRALVQSERQLVHEREQLDERKRRMAVKDAYVRRRTHDATRRWEALAAKEAAVAERERLSEVKQHECRVQAQESIACAKNASAEAIRRAARVEEEAAAKIAEAHEKARQASEQAAEALESMDRTHKRNQRLGDQMRELQRELQCAKDDRRALRRRVAELDCMERHELWGRRSPAGVRASLGSSPVGDKPSLLRARKDTSSPAYENAALCSPPTPPNAATRHAALLADLDDAHFPMPGEALQPAPPKRVRANSPTPQGKTPARPLDVSAPLASHHAANAATRQVPITWQPSGTLALGPRRRMQSARVTLL